MARLEVSGGRSCERSATGPRSQHARMQLKLGLSANSLMFNPLRTGTVRDPLRMNLNRIARLKQHVFAVQKGFHINRNKLVLADENYLTWIPPVGAFRSHHCFHQSHFILPRYFRIPHVADDADTCALVFQRLLIRVCPPGVVSGPGIRPRLRFCRASARYEEQKQGTVQQILHCDQIV